MQTQHQPELPLDHEPALERAMRMVFETRWRRWHPCPSYDQAVQDPVTRRLLLLSVHHPSPGSKKCKR